MLLAPARELAAAASPAIGRAVVEISLQPPAGRRGGQPQQTLLQTISRALPSHLLCSAAHWIVPQYEADSAPALALKATIARTEARFDK